MGSDLLLAWLATISCIALGLAIALRRERSATASTALGLLGALALSSGALGFASARGAGASVALSISALGTLGAPGLWLLLALRQRWPRRLTGAAPLVPALAPAWLSLFAEPLCRLSSPLAFAGTAAGSALFVGSALRLWREGERRAGLALLLVMSAQPIVWFIALRGAVPPTHPLAAASLTVATLVLATTSLRYSLLQPPPIGHRQVVEQLRHGVLIASASGEILDENAAARRLLGGPARGRSIADAVAALAPAAEREPIRSALERVTDALEPVSLQVEADRRRHLEVSVRAIAGDRSTAIGQVAMLRDRTAERSYAEAVLRAQKLEAVGALAAGIAHEVNNPLAYVRANLGEIARLAEIASARRAKRDSKLADSLSAMGELVNDAFAGLARIQRVVSDVRRLAAVPEDGTSTVSLDAVVCEAVRLLELRASGRIDVRTRLAPDLPPIQGSAQLLVQALLGLLLNSQRATEDTIGPWVEVETGGSGETEVWVRVRDNGPPIPTALRERIHEPDLLARRDTSGRGVGTSLAAGIARDHGGALVAEPCDSGAVFVLRLAARSEP